MVGLLALDQAASDQARLQQIVLGWDYFKITATAEENAKRKEGVAKSLRTKEDIISLKEVPTTFKDMDHYLSVFEPLLLEECRAQILRGQDESACSRLAPMALCTKCETANDFHFATVAAQPEVVSEFGENDLLLLSREKLAANELKPSTYALAIVETREGKGALRLRLALGADEARLTRMRNHLQAADPTPWWLLKLCSLSTIMREYKALRSAPRLPFAPVLLNQAGLGEMLRGPPRPWSASHPLADLLATQHNASQLQAIQGGLDRTPVVLIQGPPGTGKTQTILGLLSLLLHSQPLHPDHSAGAPSDAESLSQQSKTPLGLMDIEDNWSRGAPWLTAVNPRDAIMPSDGDCDDFFGGIYNVEELGGRRQQAVHILVCAPSNAALDEIVLRLLHTGLRDANGAMYSPSLVRVGLSPHHSVAAATVDYQVEQRLHSMERSAVSAGARGGGSAMGRDRLRAAILDEASIVCSTLAFSGSGVFSRMSRGFDIVVIDEAAQAVEPSTLVPLGHGCRQVFLIGDPLQLPATVLSTKAVEYGYNKSLFRRLQEGGYPVNMLRTQYRMHSSIRYFPSKEFYNNELEDAPGVDELTKRPWHADRIFGPFFFFDVAEGKEEQPDGTGSWINKEEAEFLLCLYRHLIALHPLLKASNKVGVISPYKYQVKFVKDRLREVLGTEATRHVDVNTVDGFQGREKDVVIFSCVRANPQRGIGFLADARRMNVGLTRARSSMLVMGCAAALKRDKHWNNLVDYAKKSNRYLKVNRPYHKIFTEAFLEAMRKLPEGHMSSVDEDADTPAEGMLETMAHLENHSDDDAGGIGTRKPETESYDFEDDMEVPPEADVNLDLLLPSNVDMEVFEAYAEEKNTGALSDDDLGDE